MATTVLLRLAALTGEGRYRTAAERALAERRPDLARYPTGFAEWLIALDLAHASVAEVAIVGGRLEAGPGLFLKAVDAPYRPHQVLAGATHPGRSADPLLADRRRRHGRPTAYVCRDFVCRLPVTDAAALTDELSAVPDVTVGQPELAPSGRHDPRGGRGRVDGRRRGRRAVYVAAGITQRTSTSRTSAMPRTGRHRARRPWAERRPAESTLGCVTYVPGPQSPTRRPSERATPASGRRAWIRAARGRGSAAGSSRRASTRRADGRGAPVPVTTGLFRDAVRPLSPAGLPPRPGPECQARLGTGPARLRAPAAAGRMTGAIPAGAASHAHVVPRPAATVVLFRDVDDGGEPELLLTRRPSTMAFGPDLHVVPGRRGRARRRGRGAGRGPVARRPHRRRAGTP